MNEHIKKDRENIWHPFTPLEESAEPLLITSANGIYLHTHDGKKIMDAISSWWVNLHGHSHPAITKAVADQAAKLEHVIFAGFTHEPAINLSEELLSILPGNQSKIFFSDNGSTAVEVGLKMAIQYWYNQKIKRNKIIAIQGAYHGDTFGSMSVGDRGLFTKPFHFHLFEVAFIEFPTDSNAEKVYDQFKTLINSGEVGCFIFEPLVQAAAGMRMYPPSLLSNLIEYAQRHDVICVADEVFTGFGRTEKIFASDFLSHSPDIIAVSKGLTGGTLPLGVTACSEKVASAFRSDDLTKTFFHGHSYTANPIACAAAIASIQLLNDPSCNANRARITTRHKQFSQIVTRHKNIRSVRTLGTIMALEINAGKTKYDNELRKSIYLYFIERNILLRPLGNVLYILPPYIINNDELDLIYNGIEYFLDQL